MNVNDKIKTDLINWLCENYVDVVLTGLEEQNEYFVYTNAVIELLTTLSVNNVSEELNNIFVDTFLDKVDIEIIKYIAK